MRVLAAIAIALTASSSLLGGTDEGACGVVPFDPVGWSAGDPQLEGLLAGLDADHSGLAAATERADALVYASERVATLPDPRLTYRYFAQTPETRVGPQRMSVELSQGIPWRGKRDLEREAISRKGDALLHDAAARRLELVALLKRAYYRAAFLQSALRLNAEEIALLERFEEIALTRYATGQGIQQSVLKVQTAISRLHDRRTKLGQELRSQTLSVARLAGEAPALVLDGIELPALPRLADPGEWTFAAHPASCADGVRIDGARKVRQRRELDGRPDFRVGLGWTQVDGRTLATGGSTLPTDNGKDIVALTFGVDLPIWKKPIRAGHAEADTRVRSLERMRRDTLDGLRLRARDAATRIESLTERAELYRRVILPQAEESLASAEAAYSTDRQGFLDLLDAERVLYEVRLNHAELRAEARIAAAELEQALGRPWIDERRIADGGENHE
ncbi:hypothetical protein ABI59_13505 [Acidobacteria bacterium Mor1]|nr:hypothetical protein ABI59_13505 [Acidobacteria bacterium Mor1]